MSSENFIDDNFARWLEPAMVEQPPSRLQFFREATKSAAKALDQHELSAVLAAHGKLSDTSRAWLAAQLRAHDEAFVVDGKDELMPRLATVAVIERISTAQDTTAVIAALSTLSAGFSALQPALSELHAIASQRLLEIGSEVRVRNGHEARKLTDVVGTMPKARKPNEETGAAVDVNELAGDVATTTRAIKAIASAHDTNEAALSHRLRALDEEVEILWWVMRERDDQGLLWQERAAMERAVAATAELASRTQILPGPPSADALLARVLGSQQSDEATVAELAKEVARQGLPSAPESHTLLPLTSAASYWRELGTDDDDTTWQTAAARKLGIGLDTSHTLTAGAAQLYRELQITRLLS